MKKAFILSLSMTVMALAMKAQVKTTNVKQVATLNMPTDGGNNGAAVAWHPVQKKYYAAYAGNTDYPLAVFNTAYQLVSPEDLTTLFDVRGMWYNTVSKKLEANGYDDNGWISYKLDQKGIPQDIQPLQEGMVQPDPQSLGVFDALKKKICFLTDNRIVYYSLSGEPLDESIELELKKSDVNEGGLTDDEDEEEYNKTALCYTGMANAEFAVLNYASLQIEMYNRKGACTKKLQLPDDAVVYTNFNFSYANGIWWLFDKNEKKWIGYK